MIRIISHHKHSDLMVCFSYMEKQLDKSIPSRRGLEWLGTDRPSVRYLQAYDTLYLSAQNNLRTFNTMIKNHVISLVDKL